MSRDDNVDGGVGTTVAGGTTHGVSSPSPPPGLIRYSSRQTSAPVPATPLRQWVYRRLFSIPTGIFPRVNYARSPRFFLFFFIPVRRIIRLFLSLSPPHYSCSHYNSPNGNALSPTGKYHAVHTEVGTYTPVRIVIYYKSYTRRTRRSFSSIFSFFFFSFSFLYFSITLEIPLKSAFGKKEKKNLLYTQPSC